MKILVTEKFLENIPGDREEAVLEKMSRFVEDYRESGYNMAGMRHGVSVREIGNNRHGLRIFKFRVSKSDRVLFTFDVNRLRPEFRQSILFLDYARHDEQGQKGRMVGLANQEILNYDLNEEAIDALIDQKYEDFDYDPNRVITRVIDIQTMGRLMDKQDDKAVYYLNDEQYACLERKEAPAFIFGSAGSGKTTINIYKLFLLAASPIKVAYFTYSNFLVDDAKKLYHKIVEESPTTNLPGSVEFIHLLEYLSQETNEHRLVAYPEFERWAAVHHPVLLRQAGVSILDVYKEIRGILKGLIPKEWINYRVPSNIGKLAPEVAEALVRQGLAKIVGDDLLLYSERLYAAKSEFLDPFALQGVLLMHRYLDHWLTENAMMEREVYLGLDNQYSTFEASQRQAIYYIAIAYQKWLEISGKVDENDVARLFLKKIMDGKTPMFDYVVADEIQDLTELQIYLLVRLARNRNNVLFCGDINQTIRPTYFHMGRIESIMKVSNTHLEFDKHLLVRNYRSALEVVDLANALIDLRVSTLGRNKKNDYKEIPIREGRSNIFYCDFKNPADAIRLIETGFNRHYAAIVVPDEQEKRELERMSDLRGAVFTVEEIKGIEKDYIICYNMASKFKAVWNDMLSGKEEAIASGRYYFNLLYVAMTRARHQLVFLETDMPEALFELLKEHLLLKETFDEGDFQLARTSSDNQFYKEAALYERRGLYEQAINEYRLSGLDAQKDIRRCQALQKSQQGHHLEAGHELTKMGFHALAARCYRTAGDDFHYLKALVNEGLPFEKIQEAFGRDPLEFVYSQKEPPVWLGRFNKLYKLEMARRLKSIDAMAGKIEQLLRRDA